MSDVGVLKAVAGGVEVRVKVVPGASRSRVMGLLGDRLKVAVSAPPEGGKANQALCELLAETLGVPSRGVSVMSGHSQAQKTVLVTGVGVAAARAALGV